MTGVVNWRAEGGGRRGVWCEAEPGKESQMSFPKYFNVCLFLFPSN